MMKRTKSRRNQAAHEREARGLSSFVYVHLTCTSGGQPVWRSSEEEDPRRADLPDRDVRVPPPIRTLGPYLVGVGGYDSVEHAVDCDPGFDGSLGQDASWFEDPGWINTYLHGVSPFQGLTTQQLHLLVDCWTCPRCEHVNEADDVVLGQDDLPTRCSACGHAYN
jgi:hypothetical protein